MIVCITGPDFAGKSTLINELSRDTDTFVHNGTYADMGSAELFQVYSDQIDDAIELDAIGKNVWIDRAPIDEFIYGPLYRGSGRLSDSQLMNLEARFDYAGGIKVFMDTPDEILLERFRGDRGDDLVTGENQLLAIAKEYRRVIPKLKNWIIWTPKHSELIKFAKESK